MEWYYKKWFDDLFENAGWNNKRLMKKKKKKERKQSLNEEQKN